MIAALALSACLSAAPSAPAAAAPVLDRRAFAQEDDEGSPYDEGDDADETDRLRLSAWGGEALDSGGSGRGSAILGGEVAWAFDALDLGVAGYGYRELVDAAREWTPVLLLRLTERFPTRRGLEAAFSFGVGAARPDDWEAWFQVALGIRVDLGPVFLGGEIAFEQRDLLRLAAGLGVAF